MKEVIVFTNGCFDILHIGHLDLLRRARELGTKLIVGINSDNSVKALKGGLRPLIPETERAEMLTALKFVDEVRIFDAPTPQKLIEEIKPDVLVKGGDWKINEIIGADFVLENGGQVHSLPILEGYSTSNILEKIRQKNDVRPIIDTNGETKKNKTFPLESLDEHLEVFRKLKTEQLDTINKCAEMIWHTLRQGNKLLICGNGGSAADAQHIAAEFVGRFETERRGFPAISLTTDTSALTALANDYGFEQIFARQVESLAIRGDLLIAITTSGNSPNVLNAVMAARKIGCQTIGLTGEKGKKLAGLCEATVLIPSDRTARIQEAHITVIHLWCEYIDKKAANW